ncbi:MAG: hypothetical protein O7J95_18740, partial [Planctomycetota bacterium]|nr:hypothetical protein [Planctomycetota bacterium]
MSSKASLFAALALALAAGAGMAVARDAGTVTAPTRLTIQPAQISLRGKTSRQQLLVTADVGG